MIAYNRTSGTDTRSRRGPGLFKTAQLVGPALAVIVLLFGGGLLLGFLQSLGYLPAAGWNVLTFQHFQNILGDPDFMQSLLLTFYIALTSTIIAAGISIIMALVLNTMAHKYRWVHFIFQIPLTVPHLVIAVAAVFMLAPSGLFSRVILKLGLIDSSSAFPLLINDRFGIGIILTYIWKEIPFITLMILSVLRHSGAELLEVGKTLKANRWQRFRSIILPTISPSLGAASLIVFAFTFGAFEVPFLLGQTYPTVLPVWAYKNYSDVDLLSRPEGIATGILIAAIVMIAVLISQGLARAARRRGVIL